MLGSEYQMLPFQNEISCSWFSFGKEAALLNAKHAELSLSVALFHL